MKKNPCLFTLPAFSLIWLGRKPALIRHCWLLLVVLMSYSSNGQSKKVGAIDVLHYRAQVVPDIDSKTISGKVVISFTAKADRATTIRLDCGVLTIDSVREGTLSLPFVERKHQVHISLPATQTGTTREIAVSYHGSPQYGVNFYPEQEQVYTVFSTAQWLVCWDQPSDKATLELELILPSRLKAVANGELMASHPLTGNKTLYRWQQHTPIPTYIFGFAAGPFREIKDIYQATADRQVQLRYLSSIFDQQQMERIFAHTADMFRFFEQKAGMPYPDAAYTQVLAPGKVAQEMSGFTVIRDSYGEEVLADEKALWLLAHELAHQWWGNQVTCRDWNHFWLNEGMATFMTAAYKEHQFGQKEYLKDVEAFKASYLKVKQAGKDRSLVFPDWDSPSAEDRTLVYLKGAYVLHLLRKELSEKEFWQGIQLYTRTYWGKSVTTADFQAIMEKVSRRNLSAFFEQWVYLTKQP
jgi:aminopeptidase N